MKELKDLNNVQKSVLMGFGYMNKFSLGAHNPKEPVIKKLNRKMNPKHVKKAFQFILSNGFIKKHPTCRKTTYELTEKGLKACNELKKE